MKADTQSCFCNIGAEDKSRWTRSHQPFGSHQCGDGPVGGPGPHVGLLEICLFREAWGRTGIGNKCVCVCVTAGRDRKVSTRRGTARLLQPEIDGFFLLYFLLFWVFEASLKSLKFSNI